MAPIQDVPNPPIEIMVQPGRGQAIVDQTTLKSKWTTDVMRNARKIFPASLAAPHKPIGGLNTIESQTTQFKADHHSGVQHIMGKTIVNLTDQGMRSGVLSADSLSNKFNDRIILTAPESNVTVFAFMERLSFVIWNDKEKPLFP